MDKSVLSSLFSNSNEGVIVFSKERKLVYFNSPILSIIPNLPIEPKAEDFSSILGFSLELDQVVNVDLFEIEYLISVEKRLIKWEGKEFFLYRLKKVEKNPLEEQLSFFLGNIDEIVYTVLFSKKGIKKLNYISQRVEKLIGKTHDGILQDGKFPHQYYCDQDAERVELFVEKVNEKKQSGKCQFRIVNARNKKLKWVELSLYPQFDSDDFHYANFGILRDISKEIEADELLRQSELKHRLLFSEANDAIMILKGLEMVDCNEKTLSMFLASGFVDIAGVKLYELMPEKQPDSSDSILTYHYYMQKALSGESQFFYWRHSKLSGEQFDSEVSLNSFNLEGESFVQVIVRDITLRREAEEQKNQTIRSYFEIFNSSSDLTFIINSGGKLLDVNQAVLQKYVLKKDEILGRNFDEFGELSMLSSSEDSLKISNTWNGQPQKFEWWAKAGNTATFPLEMILHPGTYFGEEVIIARGRDISERLNYEANLKASEERFRTLASHAPIGIFLTDNQGQAIYVNNKLKELSLYPSIDGFMENWVSKIHPSDRDQVEKKILEIDPNEESSQYEYRIIPKLGDERWVKIQVNLLKSPEGKVVGRVGTVEDITQEILSATLLKNSEKNFRQLVEILPDSIILHSKEKIEYLNPKAAMFLKIKEGEDVSILNFLNELNSEKVSNYITESIETFKKSPYFEIQLEVKERTIEVEMCCVPFIYNNNEVAKLVIHDITSRKSAEREKIRAEIAEESTRILQQEIDDRKAAERELISAKEYTQYIINSSIDMIIATDNEGDITEFNQAASNGFGFFSTSIIGKSVVPLFANEEHSKEIISTVYENGNWSGELLCKRADDSQFVGYLSASVIKSSEGKTIGLMGVLRDVTELKEAEEELKDSIHQKEVLLKEVHHRVKNNLQVISSILNLQRSYIDDPETLTIIHECQDRIKSMAFIHESLYQSVDLAQVNFAEYLQNLCTNLKYSYMSPDRNIDLDFDIEEISLSLDSAIPCGLIVNELVSNCFKYAFADQTEGKITISLEKDDNNNKALVVHDSGKGIPHDLDFKNTDSLGLQLVVTLVDQIDGEIEYEFASGSKFIINFKRD